MYGRARLLLAAATAATFFSSLSTPPAMASPSSTDPTVVIMGDSFISGQADSWVGNPDIKVDLALASRGAGVYGATLDDPTRPPGNGDGCHRADPSEANTTYISMATSFNIACSGAQTPDINSVVFKNELPQLQQLQDIASAHKMKLIVLSIGGNDLGFSDIVATCMNDNAWGHGTCHAAEQQALTSAMPSAMANVHQTLQNIQSLMTQENYQSTDYRLILQSYPSPFPTSDRFLAPQLDRTKYGCPVYSEDVDWANNWLVPQISSGLRAQADSLGVQFVDMQNLFRGHELCAVTSQQPTPLRVAPGSPNNGNGDVLEWVRMVIQSPNWMLQESVHPNEFGHLAMANCIDQVYNNHPSGDQSCAGSAASSVVSVSPLPMPKSDLPLGLNPQAGLDFGPIPQTGHSPAQSVTLTNQSLGTLTLGAPSVTGDFSIVGTNCPTSLAANMSCSISLSFTPAALGTRTRALTVTDNGWPNAQSLALAGTGITSALSIQDATTWFPIIEPGLDEAEDVVVQNNSAAPVTLSGAALSVTPGPLPPPNPIFSIKSDRCTRRTLTLGQICSITVVFSPLRGGAFTAQLTVTDNNVPPTVSATLHGSAAFPRLTATRPVPR